MQREKLQDILNDYWETGMTSDEAIDKILLVFSGSYSVFIVCENDDYGRDLYLCTKNTLKEAEEVKGLDNTRNIYKHDVF